MKKSRFALMTALAALLTIGFIGCSEPESATTSGTDTPSQPETPVTPDVPGSTFQEQINNAKEGATVTLNASLASAGKELTITKALTVDANNIEGLSVTVSSDVANQVVFKNFKKAKFDIISPVNRSISRGDESPEGEGSFKKFGDEALSLKLEGCSIEELSTVSDLALFMGSGNDKSVIDSLILKKGAEDFTFIEFDESDTETADKSLVKDLKIEDGVKEINLIGGTFDDVNFAADFSDKVDFKYDREFGDQLNFEKKDEFLEGDKIEARDIAVAEVKDTSANETNIYKFTMSREQFDLLNGHMDIIFLTDEQKNAIMDVEGYNNGSVDYLETITFDTPAYDMSLMGAFTVAKDEEGNVSDGLNAVYGASKVYFDYSNTVRFVEGQSEFVKTVHLEKYMTYSKEAVIVEVGDRDVTVYLNKNAVRKSDLLLCSGWKAPDAGEDATGTSEGGTKLSNINLDAYTPYFAANITSFDDGTAPFNSEEVANSILPDNKSLPRRIFDIPTSDKTAFLRFYIAFLMESAQTYPDVSNVVLPEIEIPLNKVTVKYYDKTLETLVKSEEIARENIDPLTDEYEYYFDKDFTKIIGEIGPFFDWDKQFKELGYKDGDEIVIYARPLRTIKFESVGLMMNINDNRIAMLSFADDGTVTAMDGIIVKLFKTCTDGKYSDPITSPKAAEDNSTVYVVRPYVSVYAAGKEEETEPLLLQKDFNTSVLADMVSNDNQEFTVYKTKDIKGDKHTAKTLYDVGFGEPVYIAPEVLIDPVTTWIPDPNNPNAASGYTTSDEKIYLADFYALLQKEGHKKYYRKIIQGHETYVEWTKESLDELLNGDVPMFYNQEAYTSAPDTTQINVVDLNQDVLGVPEDAPATEKHPVSKVYKQDLVDKFDTDYSGCNFYASEDKSKVLTLDDIKALKEDDTIYRYSELIQFSLVSSGLSDEESADIYNLTNNRVGITTKNDFYLKYKDATLYKDYYNWDNEKAEITIEDVLALPTTSDNPAQVFVDSTLLKVHIRHWMPEGSPDQGGYDETFTYEAVVNLIYAYYGTGSFGTIYKTSDETAAYTKEELLELADKTEIWIYQR